MIKNNIKHQFGILVDSVELSSTFDHKNHMCVYVCITHIFIILFKHYIHLFFKNLPSIIFIEYIHKAALVIVVKIYKESMS